MEKIPTLFARSRGHIVNEISHEVLHPDVDWFATEKLDGANVRVTVRSGEMVRLEARRNPSREQKARGIIQPWYRDADTASRKNADVWLWEAARKVNYQGVPDGEWSAEAVGPKIQGNPLNLDEHTLYFFSLIPWRDVLSSTINMPHVYGRVPLEFEELYDWMRAERSKVNPDAGVEGVVWWMFDEPVAKVKLKDYGKEEK